MIISYNDILRRHIALTAKADDLINENCKLYYDQYKSNPSKDRFVKLLTECGKSTECANKYSSFIFNSLEKYNGDDKILDLVKESIATRLTSSDKSIPYYLLEQVKFNKLCDRIYNNHIKITSKNKSIEEAFKNNADELILVESICSTVDKFNLSSVGKVSVALDEMSLLSETNAIFIDNKNITRDIVSYFMIRNNVTIDRILEAANNGDNTLSNYTDYISKDVTPIDAFKLAPNKDFSTLNICINAMILGASPAKYIFSLGKILKLFEQLIVATDNDELANGICNTYIDELYNIFCKNYIDTDNNIDNLKGTIQACLSIINTEMERFSHICNSSSINDEELRKRIYAYVSALKRISNNFNELNDSIYPDYNASILNDVEEGVTVSTIYADPRKNPGYWVLPQTAKALGIYYDDKEKVQKVDSTKVPNLKEKLISKAETISKSIEEKLKGKSKREKVLDKLVQLKHKIFKESGSIFDVVDINTNMMDCSVAVYEMIEGNINSDIMESCDEIIKDINRFELNESGLRCYFVNMGCILEFRLATEIKVILDAPEIRESYSYISGLNQYIIGKMMTLTENDLQPLSVDRISIFLNECSKNDINIEDSLEILGYTGISKSIIESANIENLSTKEQLRLSDYEFTIDINESSSMIAWGFINSIINEAKDKEEISKEDKEIKSKGFKINFEKTKLYLQALKGAAKNLSTKEQEICRQIDSTLTHFTNSVKDAVKADNREQVIKGSVIPSFSKCIKIGIVAAGSFGIASLAGISFAPAVPAIIIFGAFAGSKALMREEQQALMDELEIELKIIDKQIEQTEGENKPKKMRALLRTQKQLQREYQRLRLGNKIGKRLNSSKTGVPSNK